MPYVKAPEDFQEWVAHITDAGGVDLDWSGLTGRQCIITVATGYPAKMLKPLIMSLRKYSNAHLIIAANADNTLQEAYAGHNITVYPVQRTQGYRPYPALARIEYYLDILKHLPPSIDQLLLVDSRDILFQADPFEQMPKDDLVFFAENNDTASWTLKTTNGRWAWAMLPRDVRTQLIGQPIANGGVIAGTPQGIERMCRAKLDIALETGEWTKHTTGLDNISTNVIAHSKRAGDCRVVANHSIVSNIYRDSDMVISETGAIARRGRQPCPIVHMYDRQPGLLDHVNKTYGVDVDPDLTLNQDRSVSKGSAWKGLSHWLKLGKICLSGRA